MSAPNGWDIVKAAEKVSDDEPHAWIQWKGTEVCMDLHCACGTHGHIDGMFVYQVKCKDCGRHYMMGQNVVLAEITPEQVAAAGSQTTFHEFSEDE